MLVLTIIQYYHPLQGFNLLNYLEHIVGTHVFMEFAKTYIHQ